MVRRLVLLGLFFVASNSFAANIQVFTTHSIGSAPSGSFGSNKCQVYYVDDYSSLFKSLNQCVKNTSARTQSQAINDAKDCFSNHESALKKATIALTQAKNLGVTRIPSVVIDGKYQVVGTTDVALAMQAFASWKEAKQ